jgi:hypothetical protein
VVPLAGPGARFLLWCFEWQPRRFDRWTRFLPMAPGEVAARFGAWFAIERLTSTAIGRRRLIAGTAAYLMTRGENDPDPRLGLAAQARHTVHCGRLAMMAAFETG